MDTPQHPPAADAQPEVGGKVGDGEPTIPAAEEQPEGNDDQDKETEKQNGLSTGVSEHDGNKTDDKDTAIEGNATSTQPPTAMETEIEKDKDKDTEMGGENVSPDPAKTEDASMKGRDQKETSENTDESTGYGPESEKTAEPPTAKSIETCLQKFQSEVTGMEVAGCLADGEEEEDLTTALEKAVCMQRCCCIGFCKSLNCDVYYIMLFFD